MLRTASCRSRTAFRNTILYILRLGEGGDDAGVSDTESNIIASINLRIFIECFRSLATLHASLAPQPAVQTRVRGHRVLYVN